MIRFRNRDGLHELDRRDPVAGDTETRYCVVPLKSDTETAESTNETRTVVNCEEKKQQHHEMDTDADHQAMDAELRRLLTDDASSANASAASKDLADELKKRVDLFIDAEQQRGQRAFTIDLPRKLLAIDWALQVAY